MDKKNPPDAQHPEDHQECVILPELDVHKPHHIRTPHLAHREDAKDFVTLVVEDRNDPSK